MRLLIFGPPGAGKGTQAQFISTHYNIPHISTGDLFRENIRKDTPLGIAAKRYSDAGELVPDSVTNAMVKERLAQDDTAGGFLLDGYPRTPDQARALETFLPHGAIDAVINMIVPMEELIERLGKRGRIDDSAETIRRRLVIYQETTKPLAEYYRGKGLLLDIQGVGAIEDITQQIIMAVEHRV